MAKKQGRQIRDFVARAKSNPTTENLEALWRATFMLKGWYFLPSEDAEGPTHPTVVIVDDDPWIIAFTNVRRLEAFAADQGRMAEDGEVHLLVLDPGESMEKILAVRDTVTGVLFNPGSPETYRAPVEALEQYARHFGVPLESR